MATNIVKVDTKKLEFAKKLSNDVFSILTREYSEHDYDHYEKITREVIEYLYKYFFDTFGEGELLSFNEFLSSNRSDINRIKNDVFKVTNDDCAHLLKIQYSSDENTHRQNIKKTLCVLHKVLVNSFEFENNYPVSLTFDEFISALKAEELNIKVVKPVEKKVEEKEKTAPVVPVAPIKQEPKFGTISSRKAELETKKDQPKKQFKLANHINTIVVIIQLFSMFGLAIAAFINISQMWPFLIIAVLIFISMPLFQTVFKSNEKTEVTSGIIISCVALISLTVLSGIHINKGAHAAENYSKLCYELEHFRGYFYSIDDYLEKLPNTYKDVSEIKSDRNYLKKVINNYSSIERWNKVINYCNSHSHWDATEYMWNYSMGNIIYNHYWKGYDTNYAFYWHWDSGEKLMSTLPNNKESSKEYYFFTEYKDSENHEFFINQTIVFGYENINNKNDRFYAFRIQDFGYTNDNKAVVDAYCYKDKNTYTMKLSD